MLITREKAANIAKKLKEQGKKLVFTNGVFDILHVGHLRYLSEAKKLGDILIVGINSDCSVKILKGEERPINEETDRAEMLDGLKPVDYVVIFSEQTPIKILEELKPSIHVKGGDYQKHKLPETAVVEKNHGKVQILSFIPGKSTTGILNKIKEKN
jgi:glycerol-3-phosphate cytidylyltransferase